MGFTRTRLTICHHTTIQTINDIRNQITMTIHIKLSTCRWQNGTFTKTKITLALLVTIDVDCIHNRASSITHFRCIGNAKTHSSIAYTMLLRALIRQRIRTNTNNDFQCVHRHISNDKNHTTSGINEQINSLFESRPFPVLNFR